MHKKKLKLIIVEDEELFAENLAKKIEDSELDCYIAGIALQSETALEMIRDLEPDLVLSDIRMPRIDGLELISMVKKTNPETDFILISGCLDFEYAQKGIRLGVKEYLNKPVTQDELNNVLKKILDERYHQEYKHKRDYIRNKLADQRDGDIDEAYGRDMAYIFKVCILNRLEYGAEVILDNSISSFLLNFDIDELFSEVIENEYYTAGGGVINEAYLIVDAPDEWAVDTGKTAQDIVEAFNKKYAPKNITIVHKPDRVMLCKLGSVASLMTNELRRNIKAWHSSCIQCCSPASPVWKESQLAMQVRNFVPASIKNDTEEKIERIVSNAFRHAYLNNDCQSYLQMYTLSTINALLPLYPKTEQKILLQNRERLICLLSLATSLQEFIKVFSRKLYLIYNAKPVHLFKNESDTFLLVKDYIDENYYKELSVNGLSGKFYISSKHLIYLFNQRQNITPLQYIIRKRMEEAKKLFRESRLSVKDVSQTVGYSNVNYFCRIFKEHEGLSPTDFRKEAQNK